MSLKKSLLSSLETLLGIAVATLLFSTSALAQLTVESKSINNGDVNVPTAIDISLTFSAPLAIVGLPDVDLSGFGLELLDDECAALPVILVISPEGCPGGWSLVDGGTTLVLEDVALADTAVHTMIILYALSTDGDVLERPDVTRFSTSSTIPQGSASGMVSSADLDVDGTLVALATADVLELLSGEDASVDPVLGFADGDGNYLVDFVADGDYFVIGFQFDLSILSETGGSASKVTLEGFGSGAYDANGDDVVDPITISDGGSVGGLDFPITSQGATVQQLQAPVESIITADAPDARLSLSGGGPLEADGTALLWGYVFTDLVSSSAWITAGLGEVVFPPTLLAQEDADLIVGLLGPSAFVDYADSDVATGWYLANGGADFLDGYPDAIGAAILLDRFLYDLLVLLIEDPDGGLAALLPGFEVWGELSVFGDLVGQLEAVLSKSTGEVWVVAFIAPTTDLSLLMMAMDENGEPLLVIGSSPAAENEGSAEEAAGDWAADAQLISVSGLALPVGSDGSAPAWQYNYYSPSMDSVLGVVVSGGDLGGVLTTIVDDTGNHPSTNALGQDWIDSPEAIDAADKIAAGFLASHTGVVVNAGLSLGLQQSNPDRPIWRVIYSGTAEDGTTEIKIVDIDASTGVFVAVEEDRTIPNEFALDQNYPNPFNPETVIPYAVAENGHVRISVFNAIGQSVRVLVDGVLTEGSYTARWDARDSSGRLLPSGVYMYRFEAGATVETRHMTLVR